MNDKLVVTPKKFKGDSTTIVSARISSELVERIDNLARKSNRNRNEILQILLAFAVDKVVIKESNDGEGE